MKSTSSAKPSLLKQIVKEWIERRVMAFRQGSIDFTSSEENDEHIRYMTQHIESLEVVDTEDSPIVNDVVLYGQADLKIHVFQLNEEGASDEMADDSGDQELPACKHWMLPARDFHGLWQSLIYDECVKFDLLEYTATAMLFSDRNVDTQLITWNRVVLLHGPPGTGKNHTNVINTIVTNSSYSIGKTSLCKALAQKLSIRLSDRYSHGQLIEINAHSLFSKWFSESGKLVMKLFDHIKEMVADEDAFICVLIDEVESLTAARKSALNGAEPSDSIRVVNAVLTQIDQLNKSKNVLILTTSNITEAIDLAFVDRADIKQYIGPPSCKGRYVILRSCLLELMRVNIIQPVQHIPAWSDKEAAENPLSLHLKTVAEKCEGFSGRALRKMPFLAHAFFIQSSSVTVDQYIHALDKAVDKESAVRSKLQ
jgi:AAA+ superfamily predicted ATPase